MFTIKKTVGYSSIGQNNVATCSALINFLQDCGSFHMSNEDIFQYYFVKHNLALFLAYMQTDIIKYPSYGEEITINTWIYEINSFFGLRNYTIYDANHNQCVISYAIGAFVDKSSGKPIKIPAEVLATHPLYEKFPMEYTSRKINLPQKKTEMEEIKVHKYHLDLNNHVNNARYIDIAYEFLPNNFIPKRIRCEYKTPAKQGDIIKPYLYTSNEGFIISLCCDTGSTFAVIGFEG